MFLHVQSMLGEVREYPGLVVAGQQGEAARQNFERLNVVDVGFPFTGIHQVRSHVG